MFNLNYDPDAAQRSRGRPYAFLQRLLVINRMNVLLAITSLILKEFSCGKVLISCILYKQKTNIEHIRRHLIVEHVEDAVVSKTTRVKK